MHGVVPNNGYSIVIHIQSNYIFKKAAYRPPSIYPLYSRYSTSIKAKQKSKVQDRRVPQTDLKVMAGWLFGEPD